MNWDLALQISPWLIAALITGALIMYLILRPGKINLHRIHFKRHRSGTVPTKEAVDNLKEYRKNLSYARLSMHRRAKVRGILHDTCIFDTYLRDEFEKFKTNHTPKPGFCWEVAAYPMICKAPFRGKNHPRVGVYFIPTMIPAGVNEPDPKLIIDFLDALDGEDGKYYIPTSRRTTQTNPLDEGDEFVFDEGQLWP